MLTLTVNVVRKHVTYLQEVPGPKEVPFSDDIEVLSVGVDRDLPTVIYIYTFK